MVLRQLTYGLRVLSRRVGVVVVITGGHIRVGVPPFVLDPCPWRMTSVLVSVTGKDLLSDTLCLYLWLLTFCMDHSCPLCFPWFHMDCTIHIHWNDRNHSELLGRHRLHVLDNFWNRIGMTEMGFIRVFDVCCGGTQDKMKVMRVSKKLTLMVWLLETKLST